MWSIRFTLFFFLVFLLQSTYGQEFSYKHFSTDNGFPSSESYVILQDRMGYMWFATDHGVARYNGQEFTTYTTADGLVDNTIIRIAEDSKGKIWMIGHNNEICYWEKGHILIPHFSTQLSHTLETWESVQTFFIDKNDTLWINAISGVYSIHTSGRFPLKKQKKIADCDLPFKVIDGTKTVYFYNRYIFSSGTDNDLTVKAGYEINDKVMYKTIRFDLEGHRMGSAVYSPRTKTLFFYVEKILIVIPENGEVQVKQFEEKILSLAIDCNNDLWIGFRKCGVRYYKNADIERVPVSFLKSTSVNYTFRDREGGVWFSTLDNGVFYIPSTSVLIFPNISFLNDKIWFIGGIKDKVFIRTFGLEYYSGVCSMTTHTATIQSSLVEFQNKYGNFASIHQLGDTIHLVYGYAILMLTPDFKIIETVKNKETAGLKSFIGSDGTMLYYQQLIGILLINRFTHAVKLFRSPFKVSCAVLRNNELLVGGKKGLYRYKDGKFISMGHINPLLQKCISDMKVDHMGGLWITTTNDGLLYFKDKHISHITKQNGLVSDVCTSITIDDYHAVWVGTTKGISQLNYMNEKDGWKIRNFTKEHGFNSNEITRLYAQHDSLWVGTTNGISHALISEISAPKPLCPVYIDSIKVNDRVIDADKKSFSYKENNLKFKISALTFVNQGNHLFRYRLNGLDSTWTETKISELPFNRLPGGDFQLEVQAANSDRAWSNSALYSFTIHKPFWFTWWFIILEMALLLVIITMIIFFAVKRITRREKEKAHINKLLTEYQMKALTSQMNPHFIFNAINSIQNFILQNDVDIAYDYLEKFSRLIRTVLNNSEKKEVILQDELNTMALYVELEQLRFENSFDYVCDVDTQLNTEEIVIPALIIQPYIENAIWHGLMPLTDRKGCVSLLITKQSNKLKMILTDNGIGRQASDKIPKKIKSKNQQSMGIHLTSSRIKLFGNDITNSIQIIDNYNTLNEATGTTVEILLPFIEKY